MENRRGRSWVLLGVGGLLTLSLAGGWGFYLAQGSGQVVGHHPEGGDDAHKTTAISVQVVQPQKGGMDRTTVQTGTVQAYESVQLFAEVAGYLKTQPVDIGDRVKRGQVLAVIDVPDLRKSVQRNQAVHEQALARVAQMKAQSKVAAAELEAVKATVVQARAAASSAEAWTRFRRKQLDRMRSLFKERAIEERLVDEAKERLEATLESERSAHAAIDTTLAQIMAKTAYIEKAVADIGAAEAEAKVALADVEKSEVMVQFATLVAPYDGIVTQRALFPGDFVRAATGGGNHLPLLTVERTDRMRVVVQIPDRDVPFTDPGDTALVDLDALPGEKLKAKISRIAGTEDPHTRLMRVEIDLPNPTGKICQGMYGRVTIVLEKSANLLSVPSSCLVGRTTRGKGSVYVVRDGRARLTPVDIGPDNGVRVALLRGVEAEDQVVLHPGEGLRDGSPVALAHSGQGQAGSSGH